MAARPAMHKDANLRKRNALVIPGGLLAFYGIIGLLYVQVLRPDSNTCGDASLMVFAGACRSALLVMAIPLVIGLALIGVGAFAFRSMATCRQGHGSWTHTTLALLISLVVVPVLGIALGPTLLGPDAAFTRNGVDYPVRSVLAGLAGLGVLMLVPFGFLYAGQTRANPCCTEKGCFSPCFCDEAAGGEAPPAEPEPAPAAAPPPADDWEVVKETPKPETPAEPPAPTPEPPATPTEPTAPTSASTAPPLATRPSDPAAPPSDEMAAAAQWAQEDAEMEAEEAEDEGMDEEADEAEVQTKKPAARRRRPAKSAAKSARPSKAAKSARTSKKKT